MKKVAAMMLGVALTSSFASAGTVTFSSADPTIDLAAPGSVSFDVTVQSTDPLGFDTVDFVIGSDLPITDFVYSPESSVLTNRSTLFFNSGFFAFDVFGGGNNPSAVGAGGLLLGTVTLDPTGVSLTDGQTFDVFVDSSVDGFSAVSRGGVSDSIDGSASVTVVPEPATMTLLGLAAIGLIRRRRSA